MTKSSFWRDASQGGAGLGLAGVIFSLAGMLWSAGGFIFNLANFVVTIYLLFYYTRRRSMLYSAEEGFSYTQSLGFIVAMGIFAGIIAGAYQVVASNFLFTEMFEQTVATSLETLKQTGIYNNEMMDQMSGLMRSYIFSPIPVLISNVVGNVLIFGFYGLFTSIGTKREIDIFSTDDQEDEE
jgi:hypothetical protein